MRRLITGMRDGKACVVREEPLDLPGQGFAQSRFYEVEIDPAPARPAGVGDFVDLRVPAGSLAFITVRFPPDDGWPKVHHTDSIDLHTILSGRVELILDDGAHALSAGDCVVVAGVDHAWRTGPEGCTTSIVIIGTPPRVEA